VTSAINVAPEDVIFVTSGMEVLGYSLGTVFSSVHEKREMIAKVITGNLNLIFIITVFCSSSYNKSFCKTDLL